MFSPVVFVLFIACFSYSSAAETTTKSVNGSVGSRLDKTEVTLDQAISIVEKRGLTQCVARTICELSCDPESYGSKGKTVYQTLKQFESDTLPKLTFYKNARDKGQALVGADCKGCFKLYSTCKLPTENILRLANAITIKQ